MNILNKELTHIVAPTELLKPSKFIKSKHTLSAVEHKIFNILLKMGIERKITTTERIKTSFEEIRSFYNAEVDNKTIRKAFRTLQTSLMELETKDTNGTVWEVSGQYLGWCKFEKGDGKIIYDFDSQMIELLSEKYQYARLDLGEIAKLKSKYSITLYELVTDYKNLGTVKIEIGRFKDIFGLKESDTFYKTAEFKRGILDKAVKEINEKTEYRLKYTFEKSGTLITDIHLHFMNINEMKTAILGQKQEFRKWLRYRFEDKPIELNNGVKIRVSKNKIGNWLIYHFTTNRPIPKKEAFSYFEELFQKKEELFLMGKELYFGETKAITYHSDKASINYGDPLLSKKLLDEDWGTEYVYSDENGTEWVFQDEIDLTENPTYILKETRKIEAIF